MDTQMRPTRRQVLLGLVGSATLVALRPGATLAGGGKGSSPPTTGAGSGSRVRPATLDEFMNLSEALTDEDFSLRDEVGRQYFNAIDPAALQKLVQATVRRNNPPRTFDQILRSGALNDDQNALTAQQILTFWYSGLVGDRTADYLGALSWESLKDGDLATVSSMPHGYPDWEDRP
jgi:Membrane bound FAD containing D-sorbitol dehydrogenase